MNIIKSLNKELEKGNTIVTPNGLVTSPDAMENVLKKSYISDLKSGDVDVSISYSEYRDEFFANECIKVTEILTALGVYPDASDAMPKPIPSDSESTDSEPDNLETPDSEETA